MGDGVGGDEMFLEARLDGGFDLGDLAHGAFDLGPCRQIAERDARARACGIARAGDLVERHVRDHPQHHRVFGADMRAERACQHHAVHHVHTHLVHQQPRARVER